MKTRLWVGLLLVGALTWSKARAQDLAANLGPDWEIRPLAILLTNSQNGSVTVQTNALIELASGMNRWDSSSGQWIKCDPQLSLDPDGNVTGAGARHSIRLAQNINTAAAIEVRFQSTIGPQILRMHLLGLFYEDPVLRTNVLIADLQDSPAQLVGDKIQYFDAFDSLLADVSYSYTISGLSQQIVLREPLPNPVFYGLSSNSVHLVAITEIAEGPEPQLGERRWRDGQETFVDQTLDFGELRMVPGWAFRLCSVSDQLSKLPVTKEYRTTESGRRILLERLPFLPLQQELLKLPPTNTATNGTAEIRKPLPVLGRSSLPVRPTSGKLLAHDVHQLPSPGLPDGFVMDWDLALSSLRDSRFEDLLA